jgi:hypothetical protein
LPRLQRPAPVSSTLPVPVLLEIRRSRVLSFVKRMYFGRIFHIHAHRAEGVMCSVALAIDVDHQNLNVLRVDRHGILPYQDAAPKVRNGTRTTAPLPCLSPGTDQICSRQSKQMSQNPTTLVRGGNAARDLETRSPRTNWAQFARTRRRVFWLRIDRPIGLSSIAYAKNSGADRLADQQGPSALTGRFELARMGFDSNLCGG